MSEISKENLELSQQIQKKLTLGAEGVLTPEDNLYAEMLPEGITIDAIEAIMDHDTNVIAATAHAVGIVGVKAMKKDADLKEVTLQLPTAGKDKYNFTFGRSQQVNAGAPGDASAGKKEKFGTMRVSIDKYATGSRGQLGAVKGFLSEHAAEELSKA